MNIHPFTLILNILESWAMHGGYAFLFTISVLEAVPFIGSTIPGHTSVILAGFLARIGVLNFWWVFILASLGAVIGDMIGYYMGKTYGYRLIESSRDKYFFKSEYITKAQELIAKHTGLALVVGRFNPLTRPFMPLLVGASDSPAGKFWFYNVFGGILWAGLSVTAGYIFGIGYHAAAAVFGKAVVIVTIAAVIVIWGYSFVNKHFHIFKKYELFVLALNIFSLFGVIEMAQDAWSTKTFLANFDVWLSLKMTKIMSPVYVNTAEFITNVGGAAMTITLGVAVGLFFAYKKKWRSAFIMIFSIVSTALAVELIKAFFMRERPISAIYLILNDPSFPSAHAAMAAAFFVPLAYLLARLIDSWVKRELMLFGCFLAILAIGFSRIALNLHWASDVIAGWSLGAFCATATILLVRYIGALALSRGNSGKR